MITHSFLSGSSVTSGGTFTTNQCQNPLPVGASGSKQVTAKRLVQGGAPRPSQVRRLVAAFTAEAVIRRQNVVRGKIVAVLKANAPDRIRHTLPPIEADVAAILTEIRQAWATCPDRKTQPNPVVPFQQS